MPKLNCPEKPPGTCIECGRPSWLLVCDRCYARPPIPGLASELVAYVRNGEPVYRCPAGRVR